MSLLAKKNFCLKIFKPGLIALVSVFLGCETQEDLGIEYELDAQSSVNFVEIGLPASNFFIDSLRTDNEGIILVGNRSDDITGSVSSEGYFSIAYASGPLPRGKNSSSTVTEDSLKVDSIVFVFESFEMAPQRVSFLQEFSLVDLRDTLESRATYLASFKQQPLNELGNYSKVINSDLDTILSVTFADEHAQSFFDQLSEIAGDTLQSITTASFQSFGLIPSENSSGLTSINMFSDSTELIVYSSPVNEVRRSYQTYFNTQVKSYSYMDRDRSGSLLDGIQEDVEFDTPDGKTYLDPLSGISTTFSLDSLVDFFNDNERIIINNATISFDFESEVGKDTLTSFTTFLRKENGSFFGPALAINSFSNIIMEDDGYISLRAEPITSSLSDDKTRILQTPTLFFQQLYRPFTNSEDEITQLSFTDVTNSDEVNVEKLLLISFRNIALNRTIIKPNGVKLRIYYTEVDQ
ncbi:MAG: hypothetical protein HRT61_02955 [Ekhidna sp.]|nr:hypothetical protein [Ekhidna sp.]